MCYSNVTNAIHYPTRFARHSARAAPVPRVHCDYTATGAPVRLMQLGRQGIHSFVTDREMTEEEVQARADGRFAFVNVWRR